MATPMSSRVGILGAAGRRVCSRAELQRQKRHRALGSNLEEGDNKSTKLVFPPRSTLKMSRYEACSSRGCINEDVRSERGEGNGPGPERRRIHCDGGSQCEHTIRVNESCPTPAISY